MSILIARTPIETINGAISDACSSGDFESAETIIRYALHEYVQDEEVDDRLVASLQKLADMHYRHKRLDYAQRLNDLMQELRVFNDK